MGLESSQIHRQIKAFFQGLTMGQRVMLAASVAIVGGTLWIFVAVLGKGEYKTLYSGLSPSDAQSMSQRLSAVNITSETSSDGATLRVPANQLDKARLLMAAKGLPQSGRMGFELFDKPNWAGSDFSEKVNYQRALEGELERTISSVDGVEAARVHLVLPRESLFTDREREAKAAVLLKLSGRRLSDDAIDSITNLVASAVDNLRPEDVTVVDADGRVPLLSHGGERRGTYHGNEKMEAELADKLVATLAPVFGADQVRAKVTVEYELGTSESTQELYDPNDAVVLISQISSDQSSSSEPGGIPGTTSNTPQVTAPEANKRVNSSDNGDDTSDTQGQRSENKTFAVGKTVRHVLEPSGRIKRISAAVLVDDAIETKIENKKRVETRRKRTPDEMKQIEALAAAVIGIQATRGDTLVVENLPFSQMPIENVPAPTITERLAPLANQWAPVLHYVALLILFGLVYLLVLRPVKNQLVATFRRLPDRVRTLSSAGTSATGPQLAVTSGVALPASPLPPVLHESNPEARQASALREALAEKVSKEPQQATRLVRDWLKQH